MLLFAENQPTTLKGDFMAVLSDYIKKQAALEKLQKELEALKNDDRLVAELEFKDKIVALMAEYGKSERDVINLLAPQNANNKLSGMVKKKRRLKRYTNPHTNEVVETRGGNHKTIRGWKEQYPSDDIESWSE